MISRLPSATIPFKHVSPRMVLACLISLLLLVTTVTADGPTLEFQTVDHPQSRRGELRQLTAEQATFTLENGELVTEPRDRLVSLVVVTPSPDDGPQSSTVPPPSTPVLLFTNGDRWLIAGFDIANGELTVRQNTHLPLPDSNQSSSPSTTPTEPQSANEPVTKVPFDLLRGILMPITSTKPRTKLEPLVNRSRVSTDRLLLANGDELAGEIGDTTTTELLIETNVGPIRVARTQVAAVSFNADLLTPASAVPRIASLVLRDGSTLTATTILTSSERSEVAAIVTESGIKTSLDWKQIRRIDFYSPNVQPLDRLPPSSIHGVTYLGAPVRLSYGRNARGLSLIVGGETFPQGLGVVSRTELTYDLDGTWTEFETTVGLDDLTAAQGSVEFKIMADDQELFRVIREGRDGSISTGRLKLGDAKQLRLLVDFADRADIQDVANWCRPTLLR